MKENFNFTLTKRTKFWAHLLFSSSYPKANFSNIFPWLKPDSIDFLFKGSDLFFDALPVSKSWKPSAHLDQSSDLCLDVDIVSWPWNWSEGRFYKFINQLSLFPNSFNSVPLLSEFDGYVAHHLLFTGINERIQYLNRTNALFLGNQTKFKQHNRSWACKTSTTNLNEGVYSLT